MLDRIDTVPPISKVNISPLQAPIVFPVFFLLQVMKLCVYSWTIEIELTLKSGI